MNEWTKLKNFSHKVGINYWYIEFATKYCYLMFGKEKQENLVSACIRKICCVHKITIHTLFVMPDHVHMLVILPYNITKIQELCN